MRVENWGGSGAHRLMVRALRVRERYGVFINPIMAIGRTRGRGTIYEGTVQL